MKREWRAQFQERLITFSVNIIRLIDLLPKTPAGYAISNQLARAATSIGANFHEAQDASSLKDFIQKMSIALREARETNYWLVIIKQSKLSTADVVESLIVESGELIAILTSSVKSSKLRLDEK